MVVIVILCDLFELICFMFIELKFDSVNFGNIVVVLLRVGVRMVRFFELGMEVIEKVLRELFEIVCEFRIWVKVVVVVYVVLLIKDELVCNVVVFLRFMVFDKK